MTIRPGLSNMLPQQGVPRELILQSRQPDQSNLRTLLQSTTSRPTGILDALGKLGTTAAVGITNKRAHDANIEQQEAISRFLNDPNITPDQLMRVAVVTGNPQLAQLAQAKVAQSNTNRQFDLSERRLLQQDQQHQDQLQLSKERLAQSQKTQSETSLQPFYATGPDGKLRAFAQTRDGRLVPLQGLPENFTPAPPGVKTIDTGTGTQLRDRAGNIIDTVTKDIAGRKQQEVVGKARGERIANFRKQRNTLESLKQQWSNVRVAIQEARNAIKAGNVLGVPTATGPAGQILAGVGMTEASTLEGAYDTIKANIGFDKLQDMRANSPTGGALGNVSNAENRLLQSVQTSLRIKDSPDVQLRRLDLIEQNLDATEARIEQDFGNTYANVIGNKPVDTGGNNTSIRRNDQVQDPRVKRRVWTPEGGLQ